MPHTPKLLEVFPPDWLVPTNQPMTGWLSPQGELYGCSPWQHERLACELLTGSPSQSFYEPAGDRLVGAGWLHIGRPSISQREACGGTFLIRGTCPETDAQVSVLLNWIEEAGVQVEVRIDPNFSR